MNKEKLFPYLDKFVENYNKFIISVLLLKDIIEQSSNDDITIQELEFELQEIEILFTVQTERLIKFENKLKDMYDKYDIKTTKISMENIQNVMDDMIELINKMKK